eukprot:g1045.t1
MRYQPCSDACPAEVERLRCLEKAVSCERNRFYAVMQTHAHLEDAVKGASDTGLGAPAALDEAPTAARQQSQGLPLRILTRVFIASHKRRCKHKPKNTKLKVKGFQKVWVGPGPEPLDEDGGLDVLGPGEADAASISARRTPAAPTPRGTLPLPHVCCVGEVYDGLFLGSALAARDLAWLRENSVRAVLNVTKVGQVPSYYEDTAEFEYQRLNFEDLMDAKIERHWKDAFAFLDEQARRGRRVLVHCRAGRSRSVSVCVGWAMTRGFDLRHAWDAVRRARTNARPNIGFLMKLMDLELQLKKVAENSVNFFDKEKRRKRNARFGFEEDGDGTTAGEEGAGLGAAVKGARPGGRAPPKPGRRR